MFRRGDYLFYSGINTFIKPDTIVWFLEYQDECYARVVGEEDDIGGAILQLVPISDLGTRNRANALL